MIAHDPVALDKISSDHGAFASHGEIVPDREHRQVQLALHWDQLHVIGQGRISGNVEIAFIGFQQKSPGLATIAAIRERTGVNGIRIGQAPKIKIPGTPVIHGVPFKAQVSVMGDDLKIGDDLGSCPLRDGIDVNDVILMRVGDQDIVGRQGLDIYVFGQFIRGYKRINDQISARNFNGQGCMPEICDFHKKEFSNR